MESLIRRHRTSRCGRAASALLLATTLIGCGGAAAPTAVATRTPGARGTFSNARFSVAIPSGWRDQTANKGEVSRFSQNGSVQLLFEAPPPGQPKVNVNDVTANINVILASTPVPDDQLATYLSSVAQGGATSLSQPEPFTLDGRTGLYITYDTEVSGTPGESQDMVVNDNGVTYDIVLNTSRYAFPMQLPALQLMLSTWRWNS